MRKGRKKTRPDRWCERRYTEILNTKLEDKVNKRNWNRVGQIHRQKQSKTQREQNIATFEKEKERWGIYT